MKVGNNKMDKYINANNFIKRINNEIAEEIFNSTDSGYTAMLTGFRKLIETKINEEPAADVTKVRHGKWIATNHGGIHGDMIYRCSACSNEREAYVDEENYCPNCGAIMDDGENDGMLF